VARPTRSAPAPYREVAAAEDVLAAIAKVAPGAEPRAIAGRPHIVQFRDDHGSWVARRLAIREKPKVTDGRHVFLASAASAMPGSVPAPHPATSLVTGEDSDIEIIQHLPGHAWSRDGRAIWGGHGLMRQQPAPPGGLAAVTQLIARIHTLEAPKPSLQVVSLPDYLTAQRGEWRAISEYIADSGVRVVHIQRWQSASQRVVYAAWDVLEDAGLIDSTSRVPSHHNLWPAHVLAHEGQLGLIDWSRSVLAHPLIDIAQLIARFNGWTAASLEEVVESYLGVRALTADERRLLPVFGALDLAVETGRVLAEAYVADLDQTSHYAEQARSGAGAMLASLESIGWSIRKTNMDSKELRREARDHARAVREPGRKPRPKRLTSKRPKQ
jgi:aminoglycoside phosphotransferase (APT) family kinase protein